jgi:hypothetical protein
MTAIYAEKNAKNSTDYAVGGAIFEILIRFYSKE